MRTWNGLSTRGFWVLLAAVAIGCAADDGSDVGTLVVPYELGNGRDCDSLGVVAVRAELDDGGYSEESDCAAGELRFTLLQPGRYEAAVYGLDDRGVAIMDSLAGGPAAIDVVGGGTTVVFDPPLRLTSAPARLKLRWQFGFGSCESAAIERFAVTAWRSDGSELLMTAELPCDMPGEGRGQYRTVPDDERELSGDELGEVEIQPHDAHGLPVGKPVTFGFDSPGPGGEVRLSLDCDDGGCDGSGVAD